MKKMNKEELIEYFIEQLGDNKILGNVLTIEQIREKLNYVIEDVTYNEVKEIFAASVDSNKEGKCIINFDLGKIPYSEEKTTIVHELLHVLSSDIIPDERGRDYHRDDKMGFLYRDLLLTNEIKIFGENGRFINEGMTDILAEKISGNWHNGYDDEKDIVKVISTIVGEDIMLKKYFLEKECNYKNSLDIFKDELIKKYGEEFGNNINDYLKKIIKLSDQLEELNINKYRLNDNGKKLRKETRDEIYSTLENMINRVIENEDNIDIKIDEILLPLSRISLGKSIGENLIEDILSEININNSLDIYQKISLFDKVNKKYCLPEVSIRNLLLESNESNNLSNEEKLNYYLQLEGGRPMMDVTYDLYKKCGRIPEEIFNKKEVLRRSLWERNLNNIDKIDSIIEKIKYRRIGDYFKVGNLIYDIKGDEINKKRCSVENGAKKIGLEYELEDKECEKILQEQINDRFSQNKLHFESEELFEKVTIVGNMVILTSGSIEDEDKIINEYFSVRKNGILDKIEPGVERRLIDDMSELDIQLQEQTKDVSITEITNEIETLKTEMKIFEQSTKEIKGVEIDGK